MSIEPRSKAGSRFGGELSEYPKPWRLQYGEVWSERRPIKIYSNVYPVYGYSIGGNGHHHVDIKEEDNAIWNVENGEGSWGRPWRWDEDSEMRETLKGRWDINPDLYTKKDVVKWAVGVLREWGVLGDKNYKIEWDLDDDDPNARPEVGESLRKRALEGD